MNARVTFAAYLVLICSVLVYVIVVGLLRH